MMTYGINAITPSITVPKKVYACALSAIVAMYMERPDVKTIIIGMIKNIAI